LPSSTLAVTCSQKDKEVCFNPIKHPKKQEPEAKSIPKPKDNQTKLPIPTLNNLRLAIAPVQSMPQAFNLRPPAANTDDTFKNRCATPAKTKDIEMKKANTKAKSSPAYHSTPDIQEMYDLDRIVQEKVNKMIVHLELGKLLAISPFLQKSVSNMMKTHWEYTSKPMVANVVEVLEEAEGAEEETSSTDLVGGYDSDDEDFYRSLPATKSFTLRRTGCLANGHMSRHMLIGGINALPYSSHMPTMYI